MRPFRQLKVVATKKEHKCAVCDETIAKGERTLVESGFAYKGGFFSRYFHVGEPRNCHLKYLDTIQPKDSTVPNKLKDPSFFGTLEYRRWKGKRLGGRKT